MAKNVLKRGVKKRLRKILPGHNPDFLIAGAQKSGTTSLHYYLDQHPGLVGSRPKEVCYFHLDRNYQKGEEWYKKAFINYKNPFKRGMYFEATPEYLYHEKVPGRIYDYNPGMKIIILLREPVKRAFSAWTMYKYIKYKNVRLPRVFWKGNEPDTESGIVREFYLPEKFPSFEECIQSEMHKIESASNQEEPGLLRRGIYLPQIKRYCELFEKNQVLILGFKELVCKLVHSLNKILNFLELPKSDWAFLNKEVRNKNRYLVKLLPETERFLNDFYQPYNGDLFEYLGYQPDW